MYNAQVKARILNPERVGPIEDATHCARLGTEGEGRFMSIWLTVRDGIVVQAAWASNGCPAMIAAASAVAELSENQTASNVVHLSEEHIHGVIGQLPEGKEYAVAMALELLRVALAEESNG